MRPTGLSIVVAASVASVPAQAGWTWAVLQWVLGLGRLGHAVALIAVVEPRALAPAGSEIARSTNAADFDAVVRRFGLVDRSALLVAAGQRESIGLSLAEIDRTLRDADLLLNISGVLRDEGLLDLVDRRVYVDVDPAFTQLWHAAEGIDMGFARHTAFATIGHGLGIGESPVPTCGLPWVSTLPPVVLSHWPVSSIPDCGAFTTVANWRGYGSIEHGGVFYGQKAHALRELITLPAKTSGRLSLALAIHPGEATDLQALAAHGWELANPAHVADTPDRYRNFVQRSRGEIAVAKTGYVRSACGWISDRSVCYLASGRPVVAQDTGLGRVVPTGEGLLTFGTVDEAAEAIRQVNASYERHRRAARDLAEACFDSDRVLTTLLEAVA